MNKYKIISLVFLMSLTTFSMAQGQKRKKIDFLPKAGEFSIGISMNPLITFVGNIFTTKSQTIDGAIGGNVIIPPGLTNASIFPTASIMGKYMVTDRFAIRTNLGILVDRQYDSRYVIDDKLLAADRLSQAKLIDGRTRVRDGVSLSAGVESRIGRGRVQGYFGGSLAYTYAMESINYTYGNPITKENQVPTIDPLLSPGYTKIATSIDNARFLNDYSEKGSHTVGIIGHIGVECFVAPQISIGVEMNLSLFHLWTTDLYAEMEGYNTFTNALVVKTELVAPKSTNFVFGTNTISGMIFMNFYF